jgi:tRNA G18 (ribose-2'-O)-methylase SpoU
MATHVESLNAAAAAAVLFYEAFRQRQKSYPRPCGSPFQG